MKIKNAKILWNTKGPVKVVDIRTKESPSDQALDASSGATDIEWVNASDDERIVLLLSLFVRLIVMYKIPGNKVNEAFWDIDEYRAHFGDELKPD